MHPIRTRCLFPTLQTSKGPWPPIGYKIFIHPLICHPLKMDRILGHALATNFFQRIPSELTRLLPLPSIDKSLGQPVATSFYGFFENGKILGGGPKIFKLAQYAQGKLLFTCPRACDVDAAAVAAAPTCFKKGHEHTCAALLLCGEVWLFFLSLSK